MKVAIVNYGMGNLRSVSNAFEAIGAAPEVCDRPEALQHADRIVLPGVGAFGDGMARLRERGWIEALEDEVRRKAKPFLGLCLGLQLLATVGEEHGTHAGLDWIPGRAVRLPDDDPPLRIPHIGWDDVVFSGGRLYCGMGESGVFYFVHSFVFRPDDPDLVSGSCSYGVDFCASVEKDNIFATQFHPEKSQKKGLAVLKNFLST